MGTCSEDPHLGGASWLLGFTSLLLSVCGALTQSSGVRGSGVGDSGIPVSLKMRGSSVSFHVIRKPELPPEDNLTLEDSGLYRARVYYTRGRQYDQDFHLTVYEPVPLPQIRATVPSLTPGWCNVTVECDTTGTREGLTVSWESEGLPRELEQRPAPGPAPNPWTLAVTLPLSQPNASLTCVIRNQVDQKTATRDLGDVCGHDTGPHAQAPTAHAGVTQCVVVLALLILGAGL
ncbi:SLAM family member 8-like isoform X3 [Ursus maritimus]|uniref:SLAM family member 8-like isoform X3 n=1 Tax=Ursus maritimus TaxID=29073 RepID=A0A384CIU4_URSMA|nr:SLAM family member 8-like isoform X3 [Ursus maritimus]